MPVDDDAREFGQHVKQGGWRLGFLVARCCDPSSKGGRPPKEENRPQVNSSGKVSLREFAAKAGVSPAQISYCYKAWQLAAEDGHCAPAEQLSPEDEDGSREDLEEDDEHTRESWLTYYRKARDGDQGGDIGGEPAEEQNRSSSRRGSGGRKQSTPETKVSQAVEALAKTSEQLSRKLIQVVNATPLRVEDAELAQFAEELRRTRSALDKYCQEIDRVLERIGFGDGEDQPEPSSATE
jgi:hypothetical protein